MAEKPRFTPTEIWTPDMDPDEPILKAVEKINAQDPKLLLHRLEKQVYTAENGVVYALLNGEKPAEYSSTDAMVIFNPFANCATPNMLRRCEFIRLVAAEYGISDSDGKLMPVIMLASPGVAGTRFVPQLEHHQRQETRWGNFGPYAQELLKAVEAQDFGRIALMGYSQGADVAMAGYSAASMINLDPIGISVGDPVGVMHRTKKELRHDFMQAGIRQLKESIARSGIEHQKETQGVNDFIRFMISSLDDVNQDIYEGMGLEKFRFSLYRAAREHSSHNREGKIVVGYGSNSAIARPEELETGLRMAERTAGRNDILTTIRLNGANHTWGDQLTLLAALYMRAFDRH
jgi:hypothetical protein